MGTRFYQGDSRWGKLPYPKGDTVADAGCGLCACTTLVTNITKYKKYTPKNLRKYMVDHGFAIAGQGTSWSGITKTLEHYGYKVVKPNISSSMTPAWDELNKGNRAGVLLFSAGTRGGVTWTLGGHYVEFDGYKVKNGKHYFLTRDSGFRNNTGWYCYEDTMKGLLPQIWIVKLPKKKEESTTVKKYTGKLPTSIIKKGSKGELVREWQQFLKWYGYKITADGIFGKDTLAKTKAFQKANSLVQDGIVGTKTITKAKGVKK